MQTTPLNIPLYIDDQRLTICKGERDG